MFIKNFLIVYFYASILLAALNSFNNFLNNFKTIKSKAILYVLFPLTCVIELFIYVLYKLSEKIQ